ncbi:GNAT family N-acetyltransferase [Pyxidicoccus xibeiensis]|uniref:GNAT family N-acetyltransferase n=1 Tax=Pyxidicoccus xibeiensis TaxID=2906759 RepID=UPI0020A78ED3|nr:GNAT family N-acetyltransferase [Pyxidicoccus xibeiensis]MCP3142818.1 GNAT family N-acetyltransferase [Pyxidicoccus xibeiensis]
METTSGDYGQPRDEQELAAAAEVMQQSYAMSAADALAWAQRVGRDDLRLLRHDGQVVGTLVYMKMGQWYGGRSVPTVGVGGVGVHPVYRGHGTATTLMTHLLRDARATGAPLSTLYPATQPLYRRVGYEQAGARYEYRVQVPSLSFHERPLSLRAIEARDEAAITECYQRTARSRQGWLDRGAYVWSRVRTPRDGQAHGYLVEGTSGVEGYLYVVRKQLQGWKQELLLSDFVANTREAALRLWSFLGDHQSLATEAVWFGGGDEPLLRMLKEQTYSVKLHMHWMIRVLDVATALQARGWPAGFSGTLHLEVEDELFPENHGRFVLEVSDGEARVRRGGEGRMAMNVRTLSSLYTGFMSAEALRTMGAFVRVDDASVRTAMALFSGPPPSIRDMF